MRCSSILILLALAPLGAAPQDDSPATVGDTFLASNPGTHFFRDRDGHISRVYGRAFSQGTSPEASAGAFLAQWAGIWGADATNFMQQGPWGDGAHLQPVLWDHDIGDFRFTGVGYTQAVDGIPVFGSRLTVLVRNAPGFPAVHVTADLRDLGTWRPSQRPADLRLAAAAVARNLGRSAAMSAPELVIFAGADGRGASPRLGLLTDASAGSKAEGTFTKWRYIVDAADGHLMYAEDRVIHEVPGSVSGTATQGSGADECEDEADTAMAYARITGGGSTVYADADGAFTLPADGPDEITVTSLVEGQWFNVNNQAGADSELSVQVTPPNAVALVHNAINADEFYRAEINAYVESNVVRDYTLTYNPAYPTIGSQQNWPVNVNINDSCNAYYDYSSINFYRAGGSCNNTAFSVVVHHEYGHHLVAVGGSGQGAYGEGMGDVMGVLITGDPQLARGFYAGNCTSGIRTADNTCQYSPTSCSSCGSEIHACGQLISGCVWDMREQLMAHFPDGDDIAASLAINSILLHNGSDIDGAIPIDFLTLDDNDDDIGNGTPHYQEIAFGFDQHGLDVPQLDYLHMSMPLGAPDSVDPAGGHELVLAIEDGLTEYQPGTAMIRFSPGDGTYVEYPLLDNGDGTHSFIVPPVPCGATAGYWFTAQTIEGYTVYLPASVPNERFWSISADELLVPIDDDFEADLGWSVTGASPSPWERGIPQQAGGNWIPHADYDGSGQCYVTDNQGAGGQHDLDGTTILTSPTLDASGPGTLTWAYWLSERTNDPHGPEDSFQLQASYDEGGTWTVVRNYQSYLPQGGWRSDEISVEPGGLIEPSATLQLRFVATDETPDNRIEAGIDAVRLRSVICDSPPCPADVTLDGSVDVSDMLAVIGAWGPCKNCDEDIDENGLVNVADLLAVIGAWGPCP